MKTEDSDYTKKALAKLHKSPEYQRLLRQKGKEETAWNWQKRKETTASDSDDEDNL